MMKSSVKKKKSIEDRVLLVNTLFYGKKFYGKKLDRQKLERQGFGKQGFGKQKGLSLVELMVAMLLGIILSIGVMQVYLSFKIGYNQDEEMARMQENARYALRMLSREISMAGFLGTVRNPGASLTTPAVTNDCAGNWAIDMDNPITFVDNVVNGSGSNASVGGLEGGCSGLDYTKDDTDVIAIRRTADDYSYRNSVLVAGALNNTALYFVNDSGTANIKNGATAKADIAAAAGGGIDVWEYYANLFFIRNHSITVGDDIPTLFRYTLSNTPSMTTEALVEGIENIQIQFGIDGDDDFSPERYVNNAGTAALKSIATIRIHLLVRSVNEIPDHNDTKTYTLGNKVVGPFNDGFYRRTFSSTIRVQNINY